MMQENVDTNQMDELANAGWAQMKDLLQQHGLEEKKKPRGIILWTYRMGGLAASILLAIAAYTLLFNTEAGTKNIGRVEKQASNISPAKIANPTNNIENKTSSNNESITSKNETPAASKKSLTPSASKIDIQSILQSSETIYIPAPGQTEMIHKDILTTYARNIEQAERYRTPQPVNNTIPNFTPSPTRKVENNSGERLPVKVYSGAGINISANRNNQPGFSFSQVNLHPSMRIVFPLSKKVRLNTGLSAFSSIKTQNASTEEKELVNDVNANLYYTINKASILKASYFEVPVTLNYQFSKNWTVGAGLELSRLYQFKIKETEKSYDYNENLTATNLDRNLIISTLAAPAKKDKISLKKWNPGMVLETTFKSGPFLLSAGYHYGLSPSITTVEANGTTRHFKNEYFKIGIQYQVK